MTKFTMAYAFDEDDLNEAILRASDGYVHLDFRVLSRVVKELNNIGLER